MVQRYGKLKNIPVYIMDKATKLNAPKGYLIVQNLINGETTHIKKSRIKNISTKYPKF